MPKLKEETAVQISLVRWFRLQYPEQRLLLFSNNQNGKNKREQILLNRMGVNAGVSDLVYLAPNKQLYFIEVKKPANKIKGTRKGSQRPNQKAFQAAAEDWGANYKLVYSLEEFIELIKNLNQ